MPRITMRVTEELPREHRWIGGEYSRRDPLPLGHPRRAKKDARLGSQCEVCFTTRSTSGRCDCYADGDRFTPAPVKRGGSRPGRTRPLVTRDLKKALARAFDLTYGEAEAVALFCEFSSPEDVAIAVVERYNELLGVVYLMRTEGLPSCA